MDFLNDDKEFELLLNEAGQMAREFNDKKFKLKLMGVKVDEKTDTEIEMFYQIYEPTVLNMGC